MAAQSETTPQNEGSRGLWSPLAIFFLGTPFAALNWWRMGWKRKAVIFLGISVVVNLSLLWLRPGMPYTDFVASSELFILLPLFFSIFYQLILSFIVSRDIRVFNLSGGVTNTVNWTIVFVFIVITTAISTGMVFGFDYLASFTKYCRFPRFQDLLYVNNISDRSAFRQTLMNHFDTGCIVTWGLESESNYSAPNEEPKPSESLRYTLAGQQKGVSNSFFLLYQGVELYSQPITQAMVESRVEGWNGPKVAIEFPGNLSHAKLFRYKCFQNEGYQDCVIAFGYEHVLMWFHASQQGFADGDFEKLLMETIKNADQRIIEYEANLP